MLRGSRIKLGPIKREYLGSFLKWFNDPEIIQYLIRFRPMTRMAEEDWIENLREDIENIHFSIVIFYENKPEKLIGNCGLHNINWKDRIAEAGIVIGEKEYHNKGYGTEALNILLEYGFNTINLNRIELIVYEYNTRAIKSYKKVGFVEEGRKREFIWNNGKYYDALIMGILAKEWEEKNKKKLI